MDSIGMTVSRRVFSGATYLLLGQGGARLLSILTVPILSHLLAPESYGAAALITTALSLGAVFSLMGIDLPYARFFGAREKPAGRTVEAFCWRFAIGSGVLWGCLTALIWETVLPRWIAVPTGYGVIVGVGVLLSSIQALAQTRARLNGEFKRLAVVLFGAALIGACTAIALAFLGIRDERPLVASMIVTIVIGLIGLGAPPPSSLLRRSGLSPDERHHLVKVGLSAVVTAPVYWLLSSSDRWFLSALAGGDVAGIYAVSASIGIAGLVVSHAVFAAWLPEALKEYERDPAQAPQHLAILQRRIVMLLGSVWLLVASLGEEAIIILTAPPFHSGWHSIPWLAGAVFFYGFFHLANAGLLIRKRTGRVIIWWIAGGLLSIALNLTLIPHLGGLGAAITQCVAFAVVGIGSMVSSQAVLRLPLGRPLWAGLLALSVVGYLLIGLWGDSPLVSIALKAPVIIAATVLVARLVEPKLFTNVIDTMRQRLA